METQVRITEPKSHEKMEKRKKRRGFKNKPTKCEFILGEITEKHD